MIAVPRPRRFAAGVLGCALGVASVLVGFIASPAAASSSAQGVAANAWIVSDLAAQGVTHMNSLPPSAEVSAYEAQIARSATVGTTAASGVKASPKAGGKLGMILNSVAVLGGLAMLWPGGEESPAVPSPSGEQWSGHVALGWTNVPGGTLSSPSVDTVKLTFPSPLTGSMRLYMRIVPTTTWSTHSWVGSSNDGQYIIGQIATERIVEFAKATSTPAPSTGPNFGTLRVAPKGGTSTDPSPESDPALVPRYIDSEITCKSAGGGSQVLTQRTGPFTFDPSQPSTLPEAPDMECPAGTWLSSGKRELATEGSTETVPLTVPYAAPDWVGDQATQFPECFPVGAAVCQLKLFRVPMVQGNPEYDCHAYAAGSGNPCASWFNDPNKSEKYECRFGAAPVALAKCEPYRRSFATGSITATPETETPLPPPGGDPTPEDTPGLGTCTPEWADLLTPWWVFKAAACALEWAFVPEVSLETRLDSIALDLKTRVPFAWFSGFVTLPTAIPDSGCPDWSVTVAGTTKNVVCNSSYTDAIRAARPVLAVFMGALALWPLIRSTAYAAFPIIKPQPGMLR